VGLEEEMIIKQVVMIRQNHRAMGTRKLYEMLQPFLLEHQIKIGRDALFDLLAEHKLLVKKRKRKISTTMSYHRFHKWPNLIKDFIPSAPNELYVSDITYWKIETGYVYISFITDAYSHKIVGYQVAETLEAVESLSALKMALGSLSAEIKEKLIHHSDRGVQYCSDGYVKLLQDNHIWISMTQTGDPLENAIAERVNGILKEEYLSHFKVSTLEEARKVLEENVKLYNQERPHMSIGNLTPSFIHENNTQTERLWKNYYHKKKEEVFTC